MTKQIYFLGGTSPSGFQSKFLEQIKAPGFYTYILKGGPGTGKSTLMKKLQTNLKNIRYLYTIAHRISDLSMQL